MSVPNIAQKTPILLLDERSLESRSADWLDALVAEPYWRRILVLCETPAATGERDGRLGYIDRGGARAAIAALIPQWQAEDGAQQN